MVCRIEKASPPKLLNYDIYRIIAFPDLVTYKIKSIESKKIPPKPPLPKWGIQNE
jgi:hypothetical protein